MPPVPPEALPTVLLIVAVGLLALLGLARSLTVLRPLFPIVRRAPQLAWWGLQDAVASLAAWSRLPVRTQLVWPALLAGVATAPITARWSLWASLRRVPFPRVSAPAGYAELLHAAREAPWVAVPVLLLALVGLVRALRLLGGSGPARWLGRTAKAAWAWSDRVSRRILTFPFTLPLGLLAALGAAALTGVPTLLRAAPGGVAVGAALLALRAAYAWALARRGQKLVFDGGIRQDDVSRLSATAVERVIGVLDADDVVAAVRAAIRDGRQVSVRGKSHTMGGQTLARGGYLLDTRFLRRVRWDPERRLVWAEAGATWGDVIRVLNRHALAPMTMQSYCSFSVAGTLSANAHGITNDLAMASSVEAITLVDGRGELVTCSRTERPELFRHALGGYGLVGVMVGAWLRVVENHKLAMETASLPPARFRAVYEPLLEDRGVEVKLARMDVTTYDTLFLYVFRRAAHEPTVSDLGAHAREMSFASRVLWTWAMPLHAARRFRAAIEDVLQRPLDWSGESDRNVLMYESATPLAQLSAPLVELDETFVLQEYFVPPAAFEGFLDGARPVLKAPRPGVTLLNITVRFVRRDDDTALPYAQRDVYAFVLYFRISRAADAALGEVHRALAEVALGLGGTFYLPYRHHYTDDQLLRGHPTFPAFVADKNRLDPEFRFSNAWFRRYAKDALLPDPAPRPVEVPRAAAGAPTLRRTDSFARCVNEPELRHRFEAFLEHTFPIEDPRRVLAIVTQEVAYGGDDAVVWERLVKRRTERPFARLFELRNGVRQLRELWRQNAELLRQVRAVLEQSGRRGPLRGLASIGDPGRLVNGLVSLGLRGDVYVVHDRARPLDPIERGALGAVGTFVPIDYVHVDEIAVPSGSVDLVTMMQGLHHLPPERLPAFLAIVKRILRPGGIFLFREHDARPEVVPILDVAHLVFNAVTGVAAEDERAEIRAFRPTAGWRAVLADAGFEDLGPIEGEDLDPTDDFLLGFRAPLEALAPLPAESEGADAGLAQVERVKAQLARRGVALSATDPTFAYWRLTEWILVDMARIFGTSMDTVTWYRFPFVRMIWLYWRILDAELRAAAAVSGAEVATSSGLVMGVVIGLVATVQFLSMKAMALPIVWLYGTETPVEREQLLVAPGPGGLPPLPGAIVHEPIDGVVLVEALRHVPFTATIVALAASPGTRLLEAGGHRGPCQLRLHLAEPAALDPLRSWPQLEVVHTWRFPVEGCPPEAAVVVPVPRLLDTVRRLAETPGVTLVRVYDWD